MTEETGREDPYKSSFSGGSESDTKRARALAIALDVRKFEIELYWKRASYFWVFNGAALAGYLASLTEKEPALRAPAMLLTSCVGLIFAFAWYLVNRASKFWQSNWEAHVDLLEDDVSGPLYKTVLSAETPWWKLQGAYEFSVSKINQILSFYVAMIFALLATTTLVTQYEFSWRWRSVVSFPTLCVLLTIAAATFLVVFGQTDRRDQIVTRRLRQTSIEQERSENQ